MVMERNRGSPQQTKRRNSKQNTPPIQERKKAMKTTIKKIGAFGIAAIMTLSMCGSVFAATLTDGKAGEIYSSQNEGAKIDNTIKIEKDLIIYNTTDGTTVHNPNITYYYSIAPAGVTDKAQTVSDGDTPNDIGSVFNGVSSAVSITNSLTFSSADTTTASQDGALAAATSSGVVNVTVTPSAFTHAGIYRYAITERNDTADQSARAAAGITRGTYNNVRYLDIYVRRAVTADATTDPFVVYGYVLFKNSTPNVNLAEDAASNAMKTNGFVASRDANNKLVKTSDVDYYNTYNLKVTKDIDGALAEPSHQFPFSVALTNSAITSGAVVEYGATGTGTTATMSNTGTVTIGDTGTGFATSAIKLSDNQSVTITGIPAVTTSTVTERNDTYDIYKASLDSLTGGTSDTFATANINPENTASITTVTNETTLTDVATADTEMTVKNTIEVVSPTGLTMRFAPYVLILAAGIALFVLSRKKLAVR